MKTEQSIAKQQIRKWKNATEDKLIRMYYYACETHLSTHRRTLISLKEIKVPFFKEDLKKAIKIYEDAGVK